VSGGFANRWALADALATGSYNLLNPAATPQSVRDSINIATLRPAESKLQGVDAKISGSLGHTWAGEIGFAAGAEWRREARFQQPVADRCRPAGAPGHRRSTWPAPGQCRLRRSERAAGLDAGAVRRRARRSLR
jgi:hypothetical protein